MTITAKILADSISEAGVRLTTFQLRYPRFIHAEELTHRLLESQPEVLIFEAIPDGLMYDADLSRNASSSRAIPVHRMIEDLRNDPAMPIYWGSNKPGMQAGAQLEGEALQRAKDEWIRAMNLMIESAETQMEIGLHKQIANRILEPWAHINVVVTATQWNNFFMLRCHTDAQPEIKLLADTMKHLMDEAAPDLIKVGGWHLPYIDQSHGSFDRIQAEDYIKMNGVLRVVPGEDTVLELLKKVSVARCARVSYLTHDGKQTSVAEDLALYEKLVVNQPLHASPAEHQATPDVRMEGNFGLWTSEHLHGNLEGWIQLRKTLVGEFTPG